MARTNIIKGWDDACQPLINNIAEALYKLALLDCDLEKGRCWIEVPSQSEDAAFSFLFFSAPDGNQIRVDFPLSQRCRAISTLGAPRYLPLRAFDHAEVDSQGNVLLQDGTSVHAVNFEPVTFPKWTDRQEAIIWLTIRAFRAEHIFLRRHEHVVGIDYSNLHILHEPNVKELTRYINAHIGELPRRDGKPRFGCVSIEEVQRTLSIAGVQKVRGPKRR